jgi:serine/threonine protein kinase
VPEGDKKINMPFIPEEDPHISSEVQLDSIDETRILSRPIKEADSRQDPKVSESDNDLDETRILHKQGGNMELDSDSTKQEGDQDDNETRLLSKQGKEILLDNLTRKSDEPGKMDETEPIPDSLKQKQTTSFLKQRDGVVILFSRYEYAPDKDLIGKGGFSRVYRAFDNKLSRWVALKIYRVEDFTDRYSPIAEIKRVITFDHSNICRYLDIEEIEKRNLFGENETVQVCVMELLDGGNFSEYYKKNNNLEIFKKLLNDVFSGLSYLHKNGIIHRDIKPANILIKETIDGPVAKITDFGISKKSDSVNSESSSALIVSIPYMAPEQLNVKKYGLDEKIRYNLDLWSLGVTIYEVLTGNLLFKNSDNESSEQIMANIMAPELPEKINELPQPYRDIVLHCVVKNARDRAQKVEELMVLLNTSRLSSGGVSASAENRIADSVEGRGGSPIQTENIKTANPPNQNIQHTKKLPISVFVEDEQDRNRRGTGRDVSKPAVRLRQRREINLPVIVLSTVALLAIILFFYFRKDHATENVARNSADTLQKTNGLKIDSIVGAHVNQTIEESKPKVSELNKPVIDSVEKKKASPLPGPIHNESVIRNINKKDHPSIAPRVKKNLSEELLVKFTPDEACIIKIKNLNAGYLQDTEELGAHKVINVYLKPGKYVIVASSIRDSSKTRTFPFDVKSENVNQVVNYKISF